MLIANFVLVPLVMILILSFTSFDPALEAGLLIFSLCAGAPFLIKLTQTSGHDIALGAATMLLLMVVTVAYAPIALPLLLSGVTVDAWAIVRSLLLQMILPIAVGMLAVQFLTSFARMAQPWVGKLGNYALYIVIGTTLIGYLPNMIRWRRPSPTRWRTRQAADTLSARACDLRGKLAPLREESQLC